MDTTGSWSTHTIATVSECPNRVILLIDEATQRLRTFATYPKPSGTLNAGVCTTSGGAIYEKSTPLGAINFTTTKTPRIVDADQYVHNVSSTKQNLNSARFSTANSGLMVIADVGATARYWHHYERPATATATPTATTTTTASPSPTATATPLPTSPKLATIGTSSRTITGTNITRTTDSLVYYRSPKTTTGTNQYGIEVTVVGGKITKIVDGVGNAPIPADGYVLSGHGASRTWLRTYATVGATVALS
jgi:hypothetical protein